MELLGLTMAIRLLHFISINRAMSRLKHEPQGSARASCYETKAHEWQWPAASAFSRRFGGGWIAATTGSH